MKRLALLVLLAALIAACGSSGSATLTGSGQPVDRTFDLSGFTKIEANNTAQIDVIRGEPAGVAVQIDDNLASHLDVRVKGDTLHIGLKNGSYDRVTFKAQVTMPELRGVTLNGTSTLEAIMAGEDLSLDLNGTNVITLTGTAGKMKLKVDGTSLVSLGNLSATDVDLDVNGVSQVTINASGTVSGRANNLSTVIVGGSPSRIDVAAEGGSTVTTK